MQGEARPGDRESGESRRRRAEEAEKSGCMAPDRVKAPKWRLTEAGRSIVG